MLGKFVNEYILKVLCEIDAWATCSCSIKSFLRNNVRSSET